MMAFQVQQLNVGGYDHNFSYLVVADNGDAALVDPTGDCEKIRGGRSGGAAHAALYPADARHQTIPSVSARSTAFFRPGLPAPESSARRADQAA